MSGDSKRIVKCGVCGQESRRDNLKTKHFPRKHPGIKYSEEGEQSFHSFFSVKNSIVPSDDDPMGDSESITPVTKVKKLNKEKLKLTK